MRIMPLMTLAAALFALTACSPNATHTQPSAYSIEPAEPVIPDDWTENPLAGVVYEPIEE